jgi:hypothetical protein
MDRNHYFADPVPKETAPDYHSVIERPMYWEKIRQNLDQHEYSDVQQFKVCGNYSYLATLTLIGFC